MKQKIFGTDGIRELNWSGYLQKESIIQLGHALGTMITQHFVKPATILLGYDPRKTSPEIADILISSLVAYPITIHHAGMQPTPVICKLVQLESFDLGIIITASHNNASYNGIKIVTAQGKLTSEQEEQIEKLFFAQQPYIVKNTFGKVVPYTHALTKYHAAIMKEFPANLLEGLSIVVDCAHGAQSFLAPHIISSLGAKMLPVAYQPNGSNINQLSGTQHIDYAKSMRTLHQADFALAFDGDGDRIVIIDEHNNCFDGDDILALLIMHPAFAQESVAVGTIMSNQGLEQFCAQKNINFIRTQVGDKFVHQAMKNFSCNLGAETSGHVIVDNFSYCSDGLYTALRCLEILKSKTITYPLFEKFTQYSISLPVTQKKSLTDAHIAEIIAYFEQQITPGRLVVRYSGTEPVLRIMSESNHPDVHKLILEFITQLQPHVS